MKTFLLKTSLWLSPLEMFAMCVFDKVSQNLPTKHPTLSNSTVVFHKPLRLIALKTSLGFSGIKKIEILLTTGTCLH